MTPRAASFALLSQLSGCALLPNYVGPELTHTSHITQHFGHDGCGWGAQCKEFNAIGAVARWRIGSGGYLDVGDYYSPDMLDNRHELFEARAGWMFQVKP
jgi:hypothetical protein